MSHESQPLCGVLYVDDEEKALKYFRMAFASRFEVFIASSAEAGMEILSRESRRIGIVISDQRMPGTLGAEFLRQVREQYPGTVRILTTAYTDLQDAIDAVNLGHIYQYVVKPWDITEFGHILTRAADYHRVLSERDALLGTKMTTLQRILCSDRVKWLLLHARTLGETERPAFLRALAALVRALPEDIDRAVSPTGRGMPAFEISSLIRAEYANASRALDELAGAVPPPALPEAFQASPAAVRPLIAALLAIPGVEPGVLSVDPTPSATAVTLDAPLPKGGLEAQLFGLLVEPQTSPLGVAMFATLIALASAGGSFILSAAGNNYAFTFEDPESPSEIVDLLAERFSAADISRL